MKQETLNHIDDLIKRHPELKTLKDSIFKTLECLIAMYHQGGKLLVCGNGGSFSDSQHIVGELMKVFKKKRDIQEEFSMKLKDEELSSHLSDAVPALSLGSDGAYLTAFSNDEDYRFAFAQQVYTLGKKEDVLLCISTSGNSTNCVYAAKVAKVKGMKVISLTGEKTSKLSDISDITLFAPSSNTPTIQEYHLPIYHTICLALEEELF